MSIEGRRWAQRVLSRTDIPHRAKSVASVLAERHNGKTGQCTPGQDTLAREAGTTERTVRRALGELRHAELVGVHPRQSKSGRGRTSDSYALLPLDGVAPKVWSRHDQPERAVRLDSWDQADRSDRPTGQVVATNRTEGADQPDTLSPEPIRKPVSEKGRENLEVQLSSLLSSPLTNNTNGHGRPTQGRPNGRLGTEEGRGLTAPPAVLASVEVEDQPPPPADNWVEARRADDQAWLESDEGRAYLAKLERRRATR